jgi:ABC-type transporter MlaC component
MKRFLKVCLVAAIFFIGSQNTEAQSNILEINQAASEKSQDLRKQIKFDKEQLHDVFDAYLKYEKALANNSNTITTEQKQKITESLILTMKSILSEEQFAMYKEIEKFK